MNKGVFVAQDCHVCPVIPPVSAGAAQTGKRFNLASWAHASVLLGLGAAGGPIGAITVNVYAAESGGTGVAIPYRLFKQEAASAPFDVLSNNTATNDGNFPQTATGYTPASDAANAFYLIEIDAADVLAAANGTYIELDVAVGSLGTTAQLLAAYAILSGGRQTGDQSASAQV
jgi:hypothetical protein